MPRNMSFFLTTQQIRDRSKTVTRRRGWKFLKPGDLLNACVKCQGLKKGETVERLALIRVVSVRRESLKSMHPSDLSKEGFPDSSLYDFKRMYAKANPDPSGWSQDCTRIEFEYLD